eukprot:11824914-Prorocentrum_lima.AAC.1
MTSSLVGSEMCIRDRPMRPSRSRKNMNMAIIASQPGSTLLFAAGSTTVSYTHLTLPTICSV